ncbi:protein kinase [Streptomyces sp. NPDC053493]|uniref:serine/threonine-protein kinase n=1 Tax=Streptomyces sp. NPDC053493 TaxID=3365705 RepID=UPI0037D03E1A
MTTHDPAVSWDSDGPELLPRGHRIGAWTVEEPIGAGGWATVYAGRAADRRRQRGGAAGEDLGEDPGEDLGEDPGEDVGEDFGEEVALKVMPTAGLAPRQARNVAESARREVELGRTAGHPRLVRLLDSLVLSAPDRPSLDGAIVLVMERARCSLRELLATGVTEAEGGRLVAGICEGLAHLHRSGWVHTDLKPENILIGRDGEVRLADFGLAIELTGTHGWTAPVGTLDYLPPERWREPLAERGVQVRPSADVWALGIVVHEVFARGAFPFPGATPTARGAAVQEYAEGRAPLRMDHALPDFWRDLAADCLAPTHAARAPHTAESLLARIRAHEAGRPDTGRPAAHRPTTDRPHTTRPATEPLSAARPAPGRPRTARPRPGRRRRRAVALLAAGVCAAAGAVLGAAAHFAADDSGRKPAQVRVFNAERGCQDRTDRDRQCSLGLAIDPLRPYTAENVVPTRVWHGDVLEAECRLPEGLPVIDEEDLISTVWFRIRLPRTQASQAAAAPATAWLPAVRTKDRPNLPRCPTP